MTNAVDTPESLQELGSNPSKARREAGGLGACPQRTKRKTDKYAELARLLGAGLTGDAASYTRFLVSVTPLLRRAICRKLPAHEAEDVLQEVLISIHKARHTYDGERPLMPWLMAIVQFRITDALRKAYASSRRECVDIAEVEEFLTDVTETQDSHESIEEMLTGVPEREQRILTLMHVEGYTAKEAGMQLGMKESAVKVAAHRAIKKIRERIGA